MPEEKPDRGFQFATAEVVQVSHPFRTVRRVVARLPEAADAAAWARANVAFRIMLRGKYGDASRIYTVRHCDPALRTITFDIILHEESSPMMEWSARLTEGTAFDLVGPSQHLLVPEGAGKVALFLDATGMPALSAILAQAPTPLSGIGWVQVDDEPYFAELPVPAGLVLHRIGGSGIGDAALLQKALELGDPAGFRVWGAGERKEMRAIRAHFRDKAGLPASNVAVAGYWTSGLSNSEIDAKRREVYARLLAKGDAPEEFDDLALEL